MLAKVNTFSQNKKKKHGRQTTVGDTRVKFIWCLCEKSSDKGLDICILRHADKTDGHYDTSDNVEL